MKILRHAGRAGPTSAERAQGSCCSASPASRRSRWATPTAAVATLRSILEIDPQEREAIDAPRADLRGGRAAPPARRDAAQAHRPRRRRRRRARSCGGASRACSSATWATSTRRSPRASASSTRTPRTTSALETLARLYEQQGRHRDRLEILERRLALVAGGGPRARAELLRQIARAARGAARRSGDALERWREVLRARRPADTRGAGGAGALPGAGHRRRPAPGGGAGAGAGLRARRAASPSSRRSCASTSRRRPMRARASSS